MASINPQNLANLRGMRYGNASSDMAQIQSARQALRVLDAEITRAELRLRALPGRVTPIGRTGGASAPKTGGAKSRAAAARAKTGGGAKFFAVSDDRVRFGPGKVGASGIGLSPGFLKSVHGLGYSALAFHAVGGVGQQIMDLNDRQTELKEQGFSEGTRRRQAGLDIIGGTAKSVASLFGINSMAEMLLRPAFGKDEAARRVNQVWENTFTNDAILNRRRQEKERAVSKALDDVNRQYAESSEFLDTWTPDDFDVYGDHQRLQLRQEIRRKNVPYLLALTDLQANDVIRAAAQESTGE